MAIAVDASSPARVAASATSGTTATFNPPVSVLVVCCESDAARTFTITNNSTALTWTQIAIKSGSPNTSTATAYWAPLTAGRTGMTVTATKSGAAGWQAMKVYVITGADPTTPVGGSTTGNSTTNNLTTTGFTVAGTGSLGFAAADNFVASGAATSADMTFSQTGTAGNIQSIDGYKVLGSAGSSATFNLDAEGTSAAQWNWISFEIKAAPPAGPEPGRFLLAV